MTYLLVNYWPYVILAVLLGMAVGWWNRDRREAGVDHVTAWLEDDPVER